MENDWAVEHLQVIRTLMERSAVYRRALAPIMTLTGSIGIAAGVAGWQLGIQSAGGFAAYWMGVGVVAAIGGLLLVRRQALKAAEPFWSLPTRRVGQALFPGFLVGLVAALLTWLYPRWDFTPTWGLPVLWMILYGCSLHAAGFFMARGIRLFGWGIVLCAVGLMAARTLDGQPWPLVEGHKVMGGVFGGLHLAYGIYLYFTEKERNAA